MQGKLISVCIGFALGSLIMGLVTQSHVDEIRDTYQKGFLEASESYKDAIKGIPEMVKKAEGIGFREASLLADMDHMTVYSPEMSREAKYPLQDRVAILKECKDAGRLYRHKSGQKYYAAGVDEKVDLAIWDSWFW